MKKINISLSFRTYEERGLLAHHKFLINGYVKVICLLTNLTFTFSILY